MFHKVVIFENFEKFPGKQLYQSLIFNFQDSLLL